MVESSACMMVADMAQTVSAERRKPEGRGEAFMAFLVGRVCGRSPPPLAGRIVEAASRPSLPLPACEGGDRPDASLGLGPRRLRSEGEQTKHALSRWPLR